MVVLSPRPISKIVCTPDLRAGRREKTVFHCGVVRAEPPRSSRDIPRRLRSVRRFGAVGSEGRRAQVDRRIGKSAPRATCRGSVEEPRTSSSRFVSKTPQHPSLKTAMGSSRIKNPHHTGGMIPSLCLETRFPSEFQAKKRCENATRAFAFAKKTGTPDVSSVRSRRPAPSARSRDFPRDFATDLRVRRFTSFSGFVFTK